ncbi:MAG: hypothetical protein GW823_06825 [Bacteroidetes bacterium]|nr:hypothetical protein [Bacteroidota bacterium]
MGFNVDGSKGIYLNNLDAKGVANVGIIYYPKKNQKLQLWDTYIDKLLNTMLLSGMGQHS